MPMGIYANYLRKTQFTQMEVLREWESFILVFKGMRQFTCTHLYHVALCNNSKSCGS